MLVKMTVWLGLAAATAAGIVFFFPGPICDEFHTFDYDTRKSLVIELSGRCWTIRWLASLMGTFLGHVWRVYQEKALNSSNWESWAAAVLFATLVNSLLPEVPTVADWFLYIPLFENFSSFNPIWVLTASFMAFAVCVLVNACAMVALHITGVVVRRA